MTAQLLGASAAALFLQYVVGVSAHFGSTYPAGGYTPWAAFLMELILTFGPNLASLDFGSFWVYLAGPLLGAVLAVGLGYLLRGPGGGWYGSLAAQGNEGGRARPRTP